MGKPCMRWKTFPLLQFVYSLLMLAVFLIIDLLVLPLSHTLGFSLLSPLYTKSSEKDPREEKHSQSSVCVISAVLCCSQRLDGFSEHGCGHPAHGCTAEPDYTLTVHVSASGYVCTAPHTEGKGQTIMVHCRA